MDNGSVSNVTDLAEASYDLDSINIKISIIIYRINIIIYITASG